MKNPKENRDLGSFQPTGRQLLARILEEPELTALVQALPSRTLDEVIHHVGLEDCGELIARASTAQLERLFDEDVWRSRRPGEDESFDAGRFIVWLEVMLEAGEEFVAEKLAELPEEFLLLALQRLVLVIDADQLAVSLLTGAEDVDFVEKALDGCLSLELAEYQIVAKRHDGWDALTTVLLALDRDHHHFLDRLLARSAALSADYVEDNGGLYNVLTADEMIESDAAADREDRRARDGFISPSAATAFLELARSTPLSEILESKQRDPITSSYFRQLEPSGSAPVMDEGRFAKLGALLAAANVTEEPAAVRLVGLPQAGAGGSPVTLHRALARLRDEGDSAYGDRMQELAYLANVLAAGAGLPGRRLRRVEAAELAVAVCGVGLEHLLADSSAADDTIAALVLAARGADVLFRIGWHLLAAEHGAPVAALLGGKT